MSKKSDLGKVAIGAAIGVGAGILFAPKSGKETRQELKEKMSELTEKVKQLDSKKVKETITKKVEELEKEIKELDKEKVLKVAKDKANKIKKKADDLVLFAKKKGESVLEKTAEEVRNKALETAKLVVEKLETK